jgi:hypothetical protein
MAFWTVIIPLATMLTSMDVVKDELCMILVASNPTNNPTNGLDVVAISCSANPLPNPLKADSNNSMLTKKR